MKGSNKTMHFKERTLVWKTLEFLVHAVWKHVQFIPPSFVSSPGWSHIYSVDLTPCVFKQHLAFEEGKKE